MTKRNYQKELDAVIEQVTKEGRVPSLLLHSCCGPCSSYVLEYLSRYFAITVFYYNPNIYPPEEYEHRMKEQQRFIAECTFDHPVQFVAGDYEPERFYDAVRTLEDCPEGGERCLVCYRLRLAEAAKLADELGCDYFTTTLSISPHKNAAKLNEIGEELAGITKARHLPSDFKKRGGYKRSVELSAEHGMYRQDYCGCVFSKRERERQQQEKAQERNES